MASESGREDREGRHQAPGSKVGTVDKSPRLITRYYSSVFGFPHFCRFGYQLDLFPPTLLLIPRELQN